MKIIDTPCFLHKIAKYMPERSVHIIVAREVLGWGNSDSALDNMAEITFRRASAVMGTFSCSTLHNASKLG